jgi:hypothetical protein
MVGVDCFGRTLGQPDQCPLLGPGEQTPLYPVGVLKRCPANLAQNLGVCLLAESIIGLAIGGLLYLRFHDFLRDSGQPQCITDKPRNNRQSIAK